MVAVAAAIFVALAGSAAAQFPGMGMPMGGMMPQMGGMMPPMGGGMMPPMMGGMGGMGGMQMPPQGFPQMPPQMPNMFGNFGAPAKKPAAAAAAAPPAPARAPVANTPAPAQAQAPQAQAPPAQAQQMPTMQLKDMAKWAEMMGMPKMSDEDMKKISDMQQGMLSKLRSLKEEDLNAMRSDQNSLADEMDRVMKNPTAEEVASFQSKQENLMSQWANKLDLPKITPQEHDMMRDQLGRMFNTLKAMPANEIEALRAKHEEIKKMALAHAAN